MSRLLARFERFLAEAGFDRAPWLAVAFGGGIAAWFGLAGPMQWLALISVCVALCVLGAGFLSSEGGFPYIRQMLIVFPLVLAAGVLIIWAKSALVGRPPLEHPVAAWMNARVLEKQEQPAKERVRLLLAARLDGSTEPIRVRVNLSQEFDAADLRPGAVVRLRARLMPPAQPMLPGGYNFARTAWFSGLAATGTVLEPVLVVRQGHVRGGLEGMQAALSRHVRSAIDGSGGAIAATLASGDRGAIAEADAQAMRDSGLAHLLSISGLHVSAVIGATYFLAIRMLALWPWLALRARLPLVAAGCGAAAGIFYTLLSGSEVPTVRSCIGALLVLAAIALGREALSMRVLAIAAFLVLLLWPEAIVGPSFQLSFAAVMTIIALSQSEPVRRFLSAREEGWGKRTGRHLALVLLMGFVIEFALMPIGLFHFHKAGVYGALANVVAIPLTTLIIMPLIALSLFLDTFGLGWLGWWLVEAALNFLLGIAHWVSSRPGAVNVMPPMGTGSFLLFIAGGLWLALWRGKVRLAGLVPAAVGSLNLALLQPPDILVSGDGRHVAITQGDTGNLILLHDSKSDFVRDNLSELSGSDGVIRHIAEWNGAMCSSEFCTIRLKRGDRDWTVLIGRGRDQVPERALAAACDRSDIVIAERRLPFSCRPRWLKADKAMLQRTGGITIDLDRGQVHTVAEHQGEHGWWQPALRSSD